MSLYQEKRNKRGWIRITEAVVAIMIMASVLIVLYTNETPQVSYSDYVFDLQTRILMDVADSSALRNATLFSNENHNDSVLITYFDNVIPNNFNYKIIVCDLSVASCNANISVNQEVYVEDRIISSNLQVYSPKMLRLYIWEKK